MMRVRTCVPAQALDAAAAEMVPPFDVAHRDCCRTAGWAFARLWGVDPVFGAAYRSHAQARAFLRSFGGAEACHAALAARAGLVPAAPAPGLIGSISVPGQPYPWLLALCIRPGEWAAQGREGMTIVTAEGCAWGVPWD